jgi:hypothetical protein
MMERNADLSTALRFGRDDKGWGCRFPLDRLMMERNADLSTALRFGRDDKGEVCRFPQHRLLGREPQISPLRFASVEMTKGRFVAFLNIDCWGRTADPSTALRFGRDDKGRVVAFFRSCDWDVWIRGVDLWYPRWSVWGRFVIRSEELLLGRDWRPAGPATCR